MARRRSRFRPPFCPHPDCDFHLDSTGWRPQRWGHYLRRAAPRRIRRYRCSHCRRTFSSQTFSTTYWLKRPSLLQPAFDGLANCVGLRQLARIHAASPSTMQGLAERLGRHALLMLHRMRPRGLPSEPLVLDGFESFAWSQYHPLHVNVLVGAESHYPYGFTVAELRRKGRMTHVQKARRAELEARDGRPDPKGLERSVAELLNLVASPGEPLVIRSDEHPAYPRAFRRSGVRVEHHRTPSRAARTAGNPLFPVNRLDLLARHGGANHKRETIAYSKRLGGVAERFAIFALWLGYQKSKSEKRRDETPAQALGLAPHKWTTRELLRERQFPSRVRLAAVWRQIYERRLPTRALRTGRVHAPRYAA